ncbi:MAG: F0F1 ATP synthase subunit B [Dehalococcoidia bacterium]|nr:F0F1 ATP synthase subunit B [Dehalococcoidia bacterium]
MGIGLDVATFVGQLVSFLVLLVVLSRYAYPPIRRIMDERARRVRESVEQVELARLEYERVRAEAEEELKRARHQAHLTMVQAGAARDRLLEQAEAEARRESLMLMESGRVQISEEGRIMLEQLRREFADAVIATAGAVIAESLDAEKHKALIAKALDERLPLEERRLS